MNEQVFTITTSACAVSLVISTPSLSSVPTITSASTRFLAQPSEIIPTRTGRAIESCFIKDRTPYVRKTLAATLGVRVRWRIWKVPRLDRSTAPVSFPEPQLPPMTLPPALGFAATVPTGAPTALPPCCYGAAELGRERGCGIIREWVSCLHDNGGKNGHGRAGDNSQERRATEAPQCVSGLAAAGGNLTTQRSPRGRS